MRSCSALIGLFGGLVLLVSCSRHPQAATTKTLVAKINCFFLAPTTEVTVRDPNAIANLAPMIIDAPEERQPFAWKPANVIFNLQFSLNDGTTRRYSVFSTDQVAVIGEENRHALSVDATRFADALLSATMRSLKTFETTPARLDVYVSKTTSANHERQLVVCRRDSNRVVQLKARSVVVPCVLEFWQPPSSTDKIVIDATHGIVLGRLGAQDVDVEPPPNPTDLDIGVLVDSAKLE